jgi:hypothetical protein
LILTRVVRVAAPDLLGDDSFNDTAAVGLDMAEAM